MSRRSLGAMRLAEERVPRRWSRALFVNLSLTARELRPVFFQLDVFAAEKPRSRAFYELNDDDLANVLSLVRSMTQPE